MTHARMKPFLVVLVTVACGDRESPRPEPADTTAVDSAALRAAADSAEIERGRNIFEASCAECHSIDAPPKTAPTMREIALRYHELFTEREEGVEHLSEYTRTPDLARSLLEQHALDEWGVMPEMALSAADLRAVSRWTWELGAQTPR